MATLPDIDTTTTSYIAYWNAIDQGGVSDIAPSEVTSDGSIVSYTTYDNGIEGTYSLNTGRNATFRVKEDGWLVVYLDRTHETGTDLSSPSDLEGPWDVANKWTITNYSSNNPSVIDQNTLERAIYSLHTQFSNSGSMTYATADVALYDYWRPDATTSTLLSDHIYSNEAVSNKTNGFTYTSDTTIEGAWCTGAAYGAFSNEDSEVKWDGDSNVNIIMCGSNSGNERYGVRDLAANGDIPSAGTEYVVEQNGTGGTDIDSALANILVEWG